MGVPVFFKWLCMRNPKILRDALECSQDDIDSANPYIDNFYVDMNGLIHPSCNPKGQAIREPKNFQQQCENIYEYVDKIINIVRPRKLLYLAIDGVAPRAKMNQQRSRRFRAAMQGLEILQKKKQLLQEFKKKNIDTTEIEAYINKTSFDSNLITPGTNFLCDVATAIRGYIQRRLASHKHWKHLTVIFSDASCPGEGEHKIMEFIRQQRASPNYDPNQTHCIYGADADLIMLGLSAHEPRFFIIREVVVTATQKFCTSCNKKGHYFTDCHPAESIEDEQRVQNIRNGQSINVQFQFLNLKLVRQFLHLHFMKAKDPSQYDLQRVIDDFVFLCFFVGNDFLPHVPVLTIREGGIDILLKVYEYTLGMIDGYLTNAGQLDLKNLKFFLNEMKLYERDVVEEIIRKQQQSKLREQNERMLKGEKKQEQLLVDWSQPLKSFKDEVKKLTSSENNLENYSIFSHSVYNYKQKYYRQKFRIQPKQFLQLKHFISTAYIQALQWICYYYYKGVPSWSWFYPFHYSPFFTDINVEEAPIFELGQPFKPFQQLVAVLPPKTSHALPDVLKPLLLDIRSPIADYFPSQFEIDLVGKKFTWLGQVLLPFIDDKRLLKAMGSYQKWLNQQQLSRNKLGYDFVYTNKLFGPLGRKLQYSSQTLLQARYGQYKIEGKLEFIGCQGDVTQWRFEQPSGRKHEIKLKEGIQFTALEELNDDFFRRIDRKSYGGERFVRIIERSLGQRIHFLRKESNKRDFKSRDRTQRSRSRDNQKYRQRDRDDTSMRRQSLGDRRSNRDQNGSRQENRGGNNRENRDNRDNRDYRDHRRDQRDNRESRDNKQK